MALKGKKHDGRSSDLTFSWILTTLGSEWRQWQEYAAEWMAEQTLGIQEKQNSLCRFFESYLYKHASYAADVSSFFKGSHGHLSSSQELETVLRETIHSHAAIQKGVNIPCDFIDFIIERHYSGQDDHCQNKALVANPLTKIKRRNYTTETVRNPLPYRFILDLRHILCPLPCKSELAAIKQDLEVVGDLLPAYHYRHFKHWEWAQQSGLGQDGKKSDADWFEVAHDLIDKNDPDCVWRTKEILRKSNSGKYKKTTIYQLWSPVKAMLIFVKLHLPLRTYQVRMLDSGEADTWRYESGLWKLNDKHGFVIGCEKRPFGKGFFKRIYDTMTGIQSTGMYINTNKTADQNKNELGCGYTIPWQNEEVLYWLEKLRNWQEKYNPIQQPTDCTTLLKKHFGKEKSKLQKEALGTVCFLFRDASASNPVDKAKPIQDTSVAFFWYQVLLRLENQLANQSSLLKGGERLKLVVDYPIDTNEAAKVATLFPLHSLRVSLITAYTMNTKLPLPVISKLLAGHSRLLMTIYYTKISPSVMTDKMNEAETQLDEVSQQTVRNFLKDASMEQIQCKMAYNREESIQSALVNRNLIGWEERPYGLCLVGGNTVKHDDVSTLGGCWNGGEPIKGKGSTTPLYSSVPHGPENCIRCRWFITEARYLPSLNAHLNQLSYKAHQMANLSIEIEAELEELKDQQFFCEEQGKPFTRHDALQVLQRRYERQQVEADEYVKDWIACFNLIQKIISIEEKRSDCDNRDKLIAVGTEQDVTYALKFIETESELFHLSLLCEDAELYPDLQDELRKTPIIERRSRLLSRLLMKSGFEPIFMEMDDTQQLITGNAVMRHMAKCADPDNKLEGYRKAANYIEAEEYLKDSNMLYEVMSMSGLTGRVLHLREASSPALLEE